uniref:Transposase (Putative), gypsy type n=1 Tax=Tanacetum cinerariifolium TaxID=118510 RepID=A0A6L2L2P3_TANCI|nr:hypothetical protein [Tanacetum cinerariifolium]
MDLFAFIRHSDLTKLWIRERDLAESEVKLMKMAAGRTVSLDPPVTAASGDSEETVAKDASKVVTEKAKMKRKRKVVGDANGSTIPPKKLTEDYQARASSTGEKSLATIRDLVPDGSSVLSGVTKPPTLVSLPPTPNDGSTDSVSGPNLRTCPPSLGYVVSLDDSHRSSSSTEFKSFARSPAKDVLVTTVDVTTTVTADASIVPPHKVKVVSKNLEIVADSASAGGVNADVAGTSKLNEPVDSSNLFYASQDTNSDTLHYRLAAPALFAQLRAMDYDHLYSKFNIGAARQVCLGAEVMMWAKHTLEKKGELEDKCVEQAALLSERDAEIVHLKSLLSLKEAEAVEAIRLRGQLTVVEAADVAEGGELRDSKEKNFTLEGERDVMSEKITTLESANAAKKAKLASLSSQVAKLTFDLSGFQLSHDELDSKVASLESERDCLVTQKNSLKSRFELFKERIEALQDEQANILGDRVAELDAQMSKIAFHLDEEFYPRFFTTIRTAMAIGCTVNKGIQYGLKAGIDHGKVGRDLSVIEAYDPSDSCIVDLMDSPRLEGTLAEILGAENLQPSPKQLVLSIHRPEDDVVIGETSLSSFLQVIHLRVQRFRGEVKEKRLSLTDVITPLVEPLSSKSLTGEASTSAAPITTLLMTFASSDVVLPTSVVSDQVLDAKPHNEDPDVVTFEKEELVTSPE